MAEGDPIKRIAMWSGPRNISTAMMRAWENRSDTAVVDEPFYACYLAETGIQHPMRAEVLASQPSDWNQVIEGALTAELPFGETIQYQKHMTQHMLSELNEDWFAGLSHTFLIRHPAHVVSSYGEKRSEVTAADVGFERQQKLFDLVCQLTGSAPPVIESKDVLTNPKASLIALCKKLNVPFDENMLSWPAGPRDSDGVWAPHWYQNVEKSTGFAPYIEKEISLTDKEQRVVDECLPYYQLLLEHKVVV